MIGDNYKSVSSSRPEPKGARQITKKHKNICFQKSLELTQNRLKNHKLFADF
jgi:hypothetical protein